MRAEKWCSTKRKTDYLQSNLLCLIDNLLFGFIKLVGGVIIGEVSGYVENLIIHFPSRLNPVIGFKNFHGQRIFDLCKCCLRTGNKAAIIPGLENGVACDFYRTVGITMSFQHMLSGGRVRFNIGVMNGSESSAV